MAKTAKRIIDGIMIEVMSYGQEYYDKLPDSMYFLDKLNTWRSTVIRDMGDVKMYPSAFYQTHTQLIVEKASKSTVVNEVPVEVAENVYYTNIPELIGYSWKEILFFGTDKNFSRRSMTSFMNNEGNKYTKHLPCYTIAESGKAYIRNLPTTATRFITMKAIFSHPHLLPNYSYESTAYPISEMALPKVEYLLKKEIFESLGISMKRQENEKEKEKE